eukprot:s30_g30.t1
MVPCVDPVKRALEQAAKRAARVAVLDAAGQEPEPGDLPGACGRHGMPSLSSQPKLERAVQSKQVLETSARKEETTEKETHKLKRKAPLGTEDEQPKDKQQKATAVKARATKPPSMEPGERLQVAAKAAKVENTPSPAQTKLERAASTVSNKLPTAADSCLARGSTSELNNAGSQSSGSQNSGSQNSQNSQNNGSLNKVKPGKEKVANQDPPEPSSSDSESEDDEEVKKLKQQKAAHARYMRFSRSLKSALDLLGMVVFRLLVSLGPKTPVEIRRAGAAAARKSHHLQVLLEQWLACNGQWKASEFYYQVCQKKRSRKHGCRKWLTRSEIGAKYGSLSTADSIISQKMADAEICREQETRQYLVWDQDGEEETEDVVTAQLFEAADRDDDDDGGKKKAKKKRGAKKTKAGKASRKGSKKKKKAKCSSSESDESSESSSSLSSKSSTSSSEACLGLHGSLKFDDSDRKSKKKRKGGNSKTKKNPEKEETQEQKAKRLRKEEEAAQKAEEKKREADEKAAEKQKEADRKAAEKKINDAHKKECKKAEQACCFRKVWNLEQGSCW